MTTRSRPEPTDEALLGETTSYVDALFGPGAGAKHARFLERIENRSLREQLHRFHQIEGDTSHLSYEENYLLGLCVLCAVGRLGTATMFAKTLLHLGTKKEKILEAVGRLSMWIGGIPAAEVSLVVQRAIRDYEERGIASLDDWFPEARR